MYSVLVCMQAIRQRDPVIASGRYLRMDDWMIFSWCRPWWIGVWFWHQWSRLASMVRAFFFFFYTQLYSVHSYTQLCTPDTRAEKALIAYDSQTGNPLWIAVSTRPIIGTGETSYETYRLVNPWWTDLIWYQSLTWLVLEKVYWDYIMHYTCAPCESCIPNTADIRECTLYSVRCTAPMWFILWWDPCSLEMTKTPDHARCLIVISADATVINYPEY